MNLTGMQLVEQGIITGPIEKDNIQQHGVDLNLIDVKLITNDNGGGIIPKEGKTILASRTPLYTCFGPIVEGGPNVHHWWLKPGVYDITVAQGCKVPPDKRLFIRQRSSLLRNGALLHSSVFDAGYETDNIGTVIVVMTELKIEEGARIAQIYSSESNVVENLYNGQWQGENSKQKLIEGPKS